MTLNLIDSLKTSIYSPTHTKNTKIYFEIFKVFEESKIHSFKSPKLKKSALFADVHGPPLARLKF